MLTAAIAIIGILLFIWCIQIFSWWDMKRRRKIYIREKFGKEPKDREWNENVRGFYDIVTDGSGVDEITWNDLSMNEVFQRISQCDTSAGEEILYWKLRRGGMTPEERQLFERRVRMFAHNKKEREEIETLLCDIGKSPSSYYIPAYIDSVEEYFIQNIWVYRALQILLAASAILLVVHPADATGFLFFGVCVVNLVIYAVMKMKYETGLYMMGTAVSLIENGKRIAKRKEVEMFFPELRKSLSSLKNVFRGMGILKLRSISEASGDALGMLGDYLMGITLYQITVYNKVMRRLSSNAEAYFSVYRCIGEVDVAVSVASFRKSLPWYCLPKESRGKRIQAEEMYHPLIKTPVANSIDLEKSCLITGSNASGKSTFIKAAAVNAILAQALNTCAARSFSLPPCYVITSMAVKDDLMAGESYFIREIKYLRRILDSLEEEQMTLCAIDEILRGTNTGERIRASRAILEYLADKNCIALVATHDKELTGLLGSDYSNYHFSEEIGESDIQFSYKIIEGPAVSQNAVKLLEFAGFPEEIIKASEEV